MAICIGRRQFISARSRRRVAACNTARVDDLLYPGSVPRWLPRSTDINQIKKQAFPSFWTLEQLWKTSVLARTWRYQDSVEISQPSFNFS
jgi:hypothetical protein